MNLLKPLQPILLFISVLWCTTLSAQYGLRVKYGSINSDVHDFVSSELNADAPNGQHIEIGVDYWLKPWEKRIEFLPEIAYGFASDDYTDRSSSYSAISLIANTRIYLMDLNSDCDCPTFSKQGNFVTKGFYVEAAPGIKYEKMSVTTPQGSTDPSGIAYRLGIGAGLDIGVSNLITVNPFISYHLGGYIETNMWSTALVGSPPAAPTEDSMRELQFGLRVAFRPDYKPFGRRR